MSSVARIHAAYLHSFTATVPSIQLANDVTIRHLTSLEKSGLSTTNSPYPAPLPYGNVTSLFPYLEPLPFAIPSAQVKYERFFLVTPCRADDFDWDESERVQRAFEEVKIALELVKGEKITFGALYQLPPFPAVTPDIVDLLLVPSIFSASLGKGDLFDKSAPRSKVQKRDVATLNDLVIYLLEIRGKSSGSRKRKWLASQRFDSSYGRYSPQDKLIDTWIALEALFSPGDSREVSYRLALRTAYFVDVSGKERRTIYEDLKKSYKLRSDLVHGKTLEAKDTNLIDKTHSYLRRSLRKALLDDGFDPERLEEAIAQGTGRI